jgi:hypothetical protein
MANHPSRRGQPWTDDEALQLLKAIQRNESIHEIAKRHERTYTGIKSRLNQLAFEYHYYEQKPIDQIMKLTGLTEQEIRFTIKTRENMQNRKKTVIRIEQKRETSEEQMISLLREIRDKMNEMCEMMKNRS